MAMLKLLNNQMVTKKYTYGHVSNIGTPTEPVYYLFEFCFDPWHSYTDAYTKKKHTAIPGTVFHVSLKANMEDYSGGCFRGLRMSKRIQ